jgi:uncharacterized protein
MKKIVLLCLSVMFLTVSVNAELPLGEKPPLVTLLCGHIDGSAWSSKEVIGKVFVLFYVDPDVKKLNEHVKKRLLKEKFPPDQFGFIAVMNMAATWIPNFAIESMLKNAQKEFPYTIIVKDKTKELVKKWGLKDDCSDVVAFNKKGQVIFSKDGKLLLEDVETLMKEVKKYLE